MSESVWFEEVDSGFIGLIQSTVKVLDSSGTPQSVPVDVRKPDDDFTQEEYPKITISNLYDTFSTERYDSKPVPVTKDIESHTVILEKSALPYELFYQLDFWSLLQTEFNLMTRLWLSTAGRYFNLPVLDVSGVVRSCLVLQRGSLRKEDYLADGKRIFHAMITYRVSVELDENVRETVPMVTEEMSVEKADQ